MQFGHLVFREIVDLCYATSQQESVQFGVLGTALKAAMPETTVELVSGVGVSVVTVYGVNGAKDRFLAVIADVLEALAM